MKTIKCGNCGAELQLEEGVTVVECEECGATTDAAAEVEETGDEADEKEPATKEEKLEKIISIEKELAEKREELDDLGVLRIREKKEIREEIEELEAQLAEYKTEAIDLYVGEHSKIGEIARYIRIGDTVNYGNYYGQTEWIVLDKTERAMLVISKYAIKEADYSNYRQVTWENSKLRSWLNGEFFTFTFRENERDRILRTNLENADNSRYRTEGGKKTADKVFLLSIDEVEKYFRSDEDRIATLPDETPVVWWLRSPGHNSTSAANVGEEGSISVKGEIVYRDEIYVRPAMWIETKGHKTR